MEQWLRQKMRLQEVKIDNGIINDVGHKVNMSKHVSFVLINK